MPKRKGIEISVFTIVVSLITLLLNNCLKIYTQTLDTTSKSDQQATAGKLDYYEQLNKSITAKIDGICGDTSKLTTDQQTICLKLYQSEHEAIEAFTQIKK